MKLLLCSLSPNFMGLTIVIVGSLLEVTTSPTSPELTICFA
ncbi:hypothetical protein [Candidatus Tisiphia endosymbiont of Sialis lutaria]